MTVRRVVPNLFAEDIPAAHEFYVGLLGFEVAMDFGWIATVASPSNPTAQVSLQSTVEPRLTVEVENVDAVYRSAQERGDEIVYELTDEAWGVRRFFVRDPTGAVVNVMAHLPE